MLIDQAVILAGGLGTRLGEVSMETPKPMHIINQHPFLEYVIWNLKRYGIKNIILSVGHLSDVIINYFGDGSGFGVHITYVSENKPLGTAGALKLCKPHLSDKFLFMNGDTIFDINLDDLALASRTENDSDILALRSVDDSSHYGQVVLSGHLIKSFTEKQEKGLGLISGGIALLHKRTIDIIPDGSCSMEYDIYPLLAAKGRLIGKEYKGFFIDIGLPETLLSAEKLVPIWRSKRTVMLDRDGVINIDKGYVNSPDRFEWTEGAVDAIKYANDAGILVIVITNQSGIARGFYTESEFKTFMIWINTQLRARGAHIDGWYYCPHHPTEGIAPFCIDCECRKPKPGLINKVIYEWDLDPNCCIMVGDKESDIESASKSGIKGFLFDPAEDNLLLKFKEFLK